ncbi:hypothetical protein [Streptosporangium sp. NPDC050280]|uniref:hypothetical protein n=1 Tax=unclassified Streptosporangium TaxID=2632669 RepID=UPI0034201DEF
MSDCGLPDLARTLCRQQAQIFFSVPSFTVATAELALEPLVNLSRLLIRSGDGDGAYHLLNTLYKAVASRSDTVIDGMKIGFGDLIRDDDHREIVRWMWTVLLADGTRALTSAGRWQDALAHLRQHNGVGRRMLDGRQVAVVASITAGDADGALALLADTVLGEPWENAVTACLTVLCRRSAHQSVEADLAVMVERYRQIAPASGLAVFGTRLGLSVIDAAGSVEYPGVRGIAAALIQRACQDGYAAREVLAHEGCAALLNDEQARVLAEVLDACALGRRILPPRLAADLSTALDTSETVLSGTLRVR